jgi:hypothetical protein
MTSDSQGFRIFDDVLSAQDHAFVWAYLQEERMEFVHSHRWVKAFRLSDGDPLRGPVYLSDAYEADPGRPFYPTHKAIDLVIEKVRQKALECQDLVGSQGKDWANFFARPYVYPAGCGLSWHRDNEHNATGAFVYYAHPYWDAQWGGEFLVAPLKTRAAVFPKTRTYEGQEKFLGAHMDNSHETPILMEEGVGTYIMPKPNRLVFLTSGVLHCIKKVEAAAGNNLRGTIQGFFQDPAGLIRS